MAPTDDAELGLARDPEDDGYHPGGLLQWALLCPHMSHGDKILFGTLASLINPNHQARYRVLTLSELCAFLPSTPVAVGAPIKTVSVPTLRRALKTLSDLGQITDPQGGPITTSSRNTDRVSLRIVLYRRPRHECGVHRNIRDALDHARGGTPWHEPAGAGSFLIQPGDRPSTEPRPGSEMSPLGSKMSPLGSEMSPDLGPDLGFQTPPMTSSMSFPMSSSSSLRSDSDPDTRAGARTEEDDKPAARRVRKPRVTKTTENVTRAAPATGTETTGDLIDVNLSQLSQARPIPAARAETPGERCGGSRAVTGPTPEYLYRAADGTVDVRGALAFVRAVDQMGSDTRAEEVLDRLNGVPGTARLRLLPLIEEALEHAAWHPDALVHHLNANCKITRGTRDKSGVSYHYANLKRLPDPASVVLPDTTAGALLTVMEVDEATERALLAMLPKLDTGVTPRRMTPEQYEQAKMCKNQMIDALVRWAKRTGFKGE